jgi:hypothetical protein
MAIDFDGCTRMDGELRLSRRERHSTSPAGKRRRDHAPARSNHAGVDQDTETGESPGCRHSPNARRYELGDNHGMLPGVPEHNVPTLDISQAAG